MSIAYWNKSARYFLVEACTGFFFVFAFFLFSFNSRLTCSVGFVFLIVHENEFYDHVSRRGCLWLSSSHPLLLLLLLIIMAPKPSSRSSRSHDMSIVGDEQERHRIQLEHNLQHNDLSLHLSSAKDDCSVEYPRRGEQIYPAFPSFHHSVENLDPDEQSHTHHGWSYRTADDDDDNAVNPYAAGSLSTAAHHASAVTFTAGLGRRDQTQSGAEYDPERPLHNMIAGVDSKLSMFQSKSNNMVRKLAIRGVQAF